MHENPARTPRTSKKQRRRKSARIRRFFFDSYHFPTVFAGKAEKLSFSARPAFSDVPFVVQKCGKLSAQNVKKYRKIMENKNFFFDYSLFEKGFCKKSDSMISGKHSEKTTFPCFIHLKALSRKAFSQNVRRGRAFLRKPFFKKSGFSKNILRNAIFRKIKKQGQA